MHTGNGKHAEESFIMKQENVLCFAARSLRAVGSFTGISLEVDKYRLLFSDRRLLQFVPRHLAEKDPYYKQIIPYVIIAANGGESVLVYRRGKVGEEQRLHSFYSLGISGHLNDTDADYNAGMMRELKEEIDLTPDNSKIVAVINEDISEVGKVHFGVVHVVYVSSESEVLAKCGSIEEPKFIPIAKIERANLERWSQYVHDRLAEICLMNKYHSLETIMKNAKTFGGNETPKPESVTQEREHDRLLGPILLANKKAKEQSGK
jgi:predicted NUDIX family phosphoesterase